jgi:hypothetical protein
MPNEDSSVILTEEKTSDEGQGLHGRADHLALGLKMGLSVGQVHACVSKA